VQPLRDELLPGAVLAGDEHVRVGGSDALDELQHRAHLRRLGDERRRAVAAPVGAGPGASVAAQQLVLGVEPARAAQRAPELDEVAQRHEEPRVVPRLLDVVLCAAAHRLDRAADAPPRRHHRHRQVRLELLEAVEQVEPLLSGRRVARVVHVHQQRVVVASLERRQHAGGRRHGDDLEPLPLEQQAQRLQHVRLVVSDENGRRRSGRRRARKDGHRRGT
jgi:hypothetical protein